jgi:hypothetical protein
VTLVQPTPFVTQPERIPNPTYDKAMFVRKLHELDLDNDVSDLVMGGLGEEFTFEQLAESLAAARRQARRLSEVNATLAGIEHLAQSNYEVRFDPQTRLSERAIFPSSPSQSNGIEDARFVLFRDSDGGATYYATYTAFDGRVVFSQLLTTDDFVNFRFITLNGPAVRNKGMALFGRKISGMYAMLSRQDNENIYIMYSDNIVGFFCMGM